MQSSEFRRSTWVTILTGRRNWQNLHAWLKATYEGQTYGEYIRESTDGKANFLVGIFSVLMKMKKVETRWNEVEESLDDVRQIVTFLDPVWGWELHKK